MIISSNLKSLTGHIWLSVRSLQITGILHNNRMQNWSYLECLGNSASTEVAACVCLRHPRWWTSSSCTPLSPHWSLKRHRRTHWRGARQDVRRRYLSYFLLPMVGMGCMNSSCLSLKRMVVFPAPSSPSVTTRISIFGPMCTRLSWTPPW